MVRAIDHKSGLTHERLCAVLAYEPDTGSFRWLVARKNGYAPGAVAGSTASSSGYRRIELDGHTYASARLAWFYMTGEWPPVTVDHKDLDRHNDRWANLRLATRSQQSANRRLPSHNRSGVRGVSFRKDCNKWSARIRVDRKLMHLGSFVRKEDAISAYAVAAAAAFGEFARS